MEWPVELYSAQMCGCSNETRTTTITKHDVYPSQKQPNQDRTKTVAQIHYKYDVDRWQLRHYARLLVPDKKVKVCSLRTADSNTHRNTFAATDDFRVTFIEQRVARQITHDMHKRHYWDQTVWSLNSPAPYSTATWVSRYGVTGESDPCVPNDHWGAPCIFTNKCNNHINRSTSRRADHNIYIAVESPTHQSNRVTAISTKNPKQS